MKMNSLLHHQGESYMKWINIASREAVRGRITVILISAEIRYLTDRLANSIG